MTYFLFSNRHGNGEARTKCCSKKSDFMGHKMNFVQVAIRITKGIEETPYWVITNNI